MRIDKSSTDWMRVMEALTKGRELAAQLGSVLQGTTPENSAARDLINEVMGTIGRALIALESGVKAEDNEDTNFSAKKRKMQIGGYRIRSNPSSFRTTKTKTLADGHSWRKYGQKAIYSAQFPRSYFRCTHKYDQGCKATRQVQRSDEDPSSFVITYFGEHTCRDPLEATAFSGAEDEEGSCIIDFTASSTPKVSSFLKKECDVDEVVSNNDLMATGSSLMSTSLDFDFLELETLEEFVGGAAPEPGDVSAGLQSWDFLDDLFSF